MTSQGSGLTSAEARIRLERDGPNSIHVTRARPAWQWLTAQFFHFFAIMLWVAGFLAIFAGMLQLGVAIFVVIIINGVFAFIQEYRAEQATEKLRDLLPRKALVIRDTQRVEIDASQLVVDDLVILQMGYRISADLRLLEAQALSIDMSMMSGETVPIMPEIGAELFAGTFVIEGEGTAVVTATGPRTRLAKIAELTAKERRPKSPLEIELHRVVRVIALCSVVVGAVFLGISLLVGISIKVALLFAIGVVVALVPEGLLPNVTVSLAMGAQRMARLHALVRRLESVETLGSTTFICTDKTGTLTLNQMSVVEVWTPKGSAKIKGNGYEPQAEVSGDAFMIPLVRELALVASRCSSGKAVKVDGSWVAQGNPLEAALNVLARRLGVDIDREEAENPVVRRFPFDARRRRMSVVIGDRLLVKGAPEAILSRCSSGHLNDVESAVHQMAIRGLRVLAIAVRDSAALSATSTADEAEVGLELQGLVGIEDPPRANVASSIAICEQAGIKVAMVTGDHPVTACAIAREVGLLKNEELVFDGRDLPKDDAMLGALLDRDGVVISRVSPEDKLRIAVALENRGHVLAMTGDGVNDGPALQVASIGIAMGRSGTDVAREAADLVLLDDNFATIVTAVQQGRTTFTNTKRFLTYHLACNIAELTPFVIWALSGGRFPLALGVLQILALDIGTNILAALALGAEPSSPREMKRPPGKRHLIDLPLLVRAFGIQGATESLMEMTAFLSVFWAAGWRPGHSFPTGYLSISASGAAWSAIAIGQMANAFACRSSTVWPGALGWGTNHFLLYALGIELILVITLLEFHPLASLLHHAPPTPSGAFFVLLSFPVVLISDFIFKRWKAGRKKSSSAFRAA